MKNLADLLADKETVLRGYIVLSGVKLVGHRCMGSSRTLAISYAKNTDIPKEADILWCYLEKDRGQAPMIFPVVEKEDEGDEDGM